MTFGKTSTRKIINIDGLFPIYLIENKHYEEIKEKFIDIDIIFGGWGKGYVGLPQWHPFFGKNYNELYFIDIHGEITFSQRDDVTNLWVIGFDTRHFYDNLDNCNFEFVKNEAIKLREICTDVKEVKMYTKLNKIRKNIKKNINYSI
jgi:hypothetical protein